MKTIYKYYLEIKDRQELQLPEGAQILSIQPNFFSQLFLWALVDPNAQTKPRIFHILGTGNPIDLDIPLTDVRFISTNQMPDGFVWHVFEEI